MNIFYFSGNCHTVSKVVKPIYIFPCPAPAMYEISIALYLDIVSLYF